MDAHTIQVNEVIPGGQILETFHLIVNFYLTLLKRKNALLALMHEGLIVRVLLKLISVFTNNT